MKKGDPLQTARLAGIMAAKQTAALIPLCHPLPLTTVEVDLTPTPRGYSIEARVRTRAQTGVEMEALTAVAVAALTIYDMVKAVDKSMVIGDVRLVFKSGGRSGTFQKTMRIATVLLTFLPAILQSCNPAILMSQSQTVPVYGYRVVRAYPHDPTAFTQGLQYVDGILYEGTGLNGRSSIRKVKLETGEVVQKRDLARAYFGEGITIWNTDLIQLTCIRTSHSCTTRRRSRRGGSSNTRERAGG